MHGRKVVLCVLIMVWVTLFTPNTYAARPSATSAYHYKILSGAHTVNGVQTALIILVDFQDVHHKKSVQDVESVAMSQLNAYYVEVSYGHVSITGTVYGWYTLSHTMGYYGHDGKNPGDDDNLQALAPTALAMLPSSVDIAEFKYLVIVHAGQDQADDQYEVTSDEIWSQAYAPVFPNYESVTPASYKGKSFGEYAFLSEFDGVGTFAHEWGHLFGLPDLYDTQTGDSYVGYWSLMDDGNRCCYNAAESTPSYIGGWGATLLGWLTPTVGDPHSPITSVSLNPLESNQATAMIVPLSQSRYYFVEDRSKSGSDSHLPAAGVLVYLADESLDTGHGILKLFDPQTEKSFPIKEHVADLNDAVFEPSDRFVDSVDSIYLNFLDETGGVMALYTTQPITSSVLSTQLHASNTQISAAYNEDVTTTVVLVDQTGTVIPGQKVEVDLQDQSGNWQEITSVSTGQAGGVVIGLELKYGVGAHNFRIHYAGGKLGAAWYLPSDVFITANIVPAKMIVSLTSPPATMTSSPIYVTVTDSHGNPLGHASITPYVDGMKLPVIFSDSNGRANFNIQAGQVGDQEFNVSVSLANYASTTATGSTFTFPIWVLLGLIVVAVAASAVVILMLHKTKTARRVN